ncbi:MAG: spermidine/putrescine ABC transporter ATP-binding protein [Acidimicrobiales bacterium mtb01]|nr:ABC transporter ATP-binding protein [Actinomycetota bacterium]TEX48323.1 MAG: spermidine/putrescine ABC transporter ATP-binding protein [Acidimicrobiales bacterium mtb01]
MTGISFEQVAKSFGTTRALVDFDLDVEAGEFISLLGPSGCGKTTALRVAAGFESLDRGRVIVGGSDISPIPAHRRNMGMVFQSYSLFPNLDVRANIEFGLRTRRQSTTERRARVDEMLELVQLTDQAGRFAHQLSGGQQQRVALARALAIRPDVLLLDEPLSALDAQVRSSLRDEIRRIQAELGITTIFVTHDQEEALSISDRVGVMSNGRLEQIDTPESVYRRPATPFVARFVGRINEFPSLRLDARTVECAGRRLPVASSEGSGSRDVLILIRPEDLRIDDHGFDGSIVRSTFMGPVRTVEIRLDRLDRIVEVVEPCSADVRHPGERVRVSWPSSELLVEDV